MFEMGSSIQYENGFHKLVEREYLHNPIYIYGTHLETPTQICKIDILDVFACIYIVFSIQRYIWVVRIYSSDLNLILYNFESHNFRIVTNEDD